MKWISDLFGKKKEGPISRISLSEAQRLAEEHLKPQQEELSRALAPIYAQIKEKKEELAESNRRLEKAQVKEEIHERLLRAALTNRNNIAGQISSITSTIAIPKEKDYDTALEFYNSSSRTIAACTQRSNISYEYTKLVFEEATRDVREHAKQLEEAFITLKKELDSRQEAFTKAKAASDANRAVEEQRAKKKEQESKAKAAEQKAEELKRALDDAKKRFEQLENSQDSRQLESLRKELESSSDELKKNREAALMLLSPAERMLRKFRKLAEEGRTKYADLKQIDEYLTNPAETLLTDRRFQICDIATQMRGLAGTGEMEKDPKKAEKLLQSLEGLKPEKIRPMQMRHESLTLKREALEKKISESKVESEKNEINAEIGRMSGQISELEAESARAKSNLTLIDAEMAKKKAGLEKALGELLGHEARLEE